MRIPAKTSTAKCTLPLYISFISGEPKFPNCQRLSEVIPVSHDSVNRFLLRENYTPADLFNEIKGHIALENGTLSVDDTVIEKPYMTPSLKNLIGWFWSGKHKRPVKGLNLITLYHTDINGIQTPVNYRIYDKSEEKTKNDYFQDMLNEVYDRGLRPLWVTGDAWYSGNNNLEFIKNYGPGFMFGIKGCRLASVSKIKGYCHVEELDIPEDGITCFLKGFGKVTIFKKLFKDEYRFYIMSLKNEESGEAWKQDDFIKVHDTHWNIERYHRAIKQVCNIERFQTRTQKAIDNHIFCSIASFVRLEFMRAGGLISNWYKLQRNLFDEAIRLFILSGKTDERIPF